MRIILYCFLIFLVISGYGCNQPEKNTRVPNFVEGSDWMVWDSTRIQRIEKLVDSMNYWLPRGGYEQYQFSPGFLHQYDQLKYFAKDGKIIAINIFVDNDSISRSQVYLTNDGKLIWAKRRFWNKTGEHPDAGEFTFFLDNDSIFFVSDKYLSLNPGEAPTKIGRTGLTPSKMERDSLRDLLLSDWQKVYQLAKEH